MGKPNVKRIDVPLPGPVATPSPTFCILVGIWLAPKRHAGPGTYLGT